MKELVFKFKYPAIALLILLIIFLISTLKTDLSNIETRENINVISEEGTTVFQLEYLDNYTFVKTESGQVLLKLNGDYLSYTVDSTDNHLILSNGTNLLIINKSDQKVKSYTLDKIPEKILISPNSQKVLYANSGKVYQLDSQINFDYPIELFAFDEESNLYVANDGLYLVEEDHQIKLQDFPKELKSPLSLEVSKSGSSALVKTNAKDFIFNLEKN